MCLAVVAPTLRESTNKTSMVSSHWFPLKRHCNSIRAGMGPLTATHWINDLEDAWTFDLSKPLILFPSSQTWSGHPCVPCGEQLHYIGMEKVWLPQHQISRCCADISTVSARGVFLRERCHAAVGGLRRCSWPEHRRHEAFLQDHAN